MTEHSHPNHLPPEMLAALLQSVRRRQQRGDTAGARVVLHALAAQQPDDPRIWLALATVAETRDEQRQSLERALTLDPQNDLARRALERFDGSNGTPAASAPHAHGPSEQTPLAQIPAISGTAESARPATTDDNLARAIRWPLYLVIGIAVVLVLIAAVALQFAPSPVAQLPAPTPALPDAGAATEPAAVSAPASPLPAGESEPATAAGAAPASPSVAPIPTTQPATIATTPVQTAAPPPTAPPTPPSPTPSPTAQPRLAPGAVVELKPWHVSLLRPDYAVLLDGAIGTLQPRGRFALALIAIGNDGAAPARIPTDLFTLQDRQGNRYQPLPNASTAYLNTYGRGQRGDLSMEEDIPPGGGNVSVPLIFDVPPNARDLTLHVGGQSLGWAIGSGATPTATAAP
jgi:tetratricopeptide repeat protein